MSPLATIVSDQSTQDAWQPYDAKKPSPVPEPSFYGLIFVGVALFAVYIRRRKDHA